MYDWRPIDTAPHHQNVLVAYRNEYGNWRRVRACYYGEGELMSDDSYDDADEDGYAPEGWYEECDESNFALPISYEPILWHPLPKIDDQIFNKLEGN